MIYKLIDKFENVLKTKNTNQSKVVLLILVLIVVLGLFGINYINNQRLGGEIIINSLIKKIMSLDTDSIHNMFIESIYIDGEKVFINDLQFNWNERIVAQDISVN